MLENTPSSGCEKNLYYIHIELISIATNLHFLFHERSMSCLSIISRDAFEYVMCIGHPPFYVLRENYHVGLKTVKYKTFVYSHENNSR